MLNLKSDADVMQKELDKMGKPKGTSVVKASTNTADFEEMIKQHLNKIKNSGK